MCAPCSGPWTHRQCFCTPAVSGTEAGLKETEDPSGKASRLLKQAYGESHSEGRKEG